MEAGKNLEKMKYWIQRSYQNEYAIKWTNVLIAGLIRALISYITR